MSAEADTTLDGQAVVAVLRAIAGDNSGLGLSLVSLTIKLKQAHGH